MYMRNCNLQVTVLSQELKAILQFFVISSQSVVSSATNNICSAITAKLQRNSGLSSSLFHRQNIAGIHSGMAFEGNPARTLKKRSVFSIKLRSNSALKSTGLVCIAPWLQAKSLGDKKNTSEYIYPGPFFLFDVM